MTEALFPDVPCWRCGTPRPVHVGGLWGLHFDECMAGTGLDGLNYDLVPEPSWPSDDPTGPRYIAQVAS